MILYIISGVGAWLWTSLELATPWLVSLGLIEWASAIVALFGFGFVFFWI